MYNVEICCFVIHIFFYNWKNVLNAQSIILIGLKAWLSPGWNEFPQVDLHDVLQLKTCFHAGEIERSLGSHKVISRIPGMLPYFFNTPPWVARMCSERPWLFRTTLCALSVTPFSKHRD